MTRAVGRRDFLTRSAAFAGVVGGGFTCVEVASAAPIGVPVVDKVSIRVLVDSANSILRPVTVNGERMPPPPLTTELPSANRPQPGLSLWLESRQGNEDRTLMLDFGDRADVLISNMGLKGVDVRKIDALIVSHGDVDHIGGLLGFLDKYRSLLRPDVKIYAGGENNFCNPLVRTVGTWIDYRTRNRRALAARRVSTVFCEHPTVIAGHAFTTGPIKRSECENASPDRMGKSEIKYVPGWAHFSADELQGKVVADEHTHEHATCFNVKDRGLVVISSCSHVGVLNTIRQAQEVAGTKKLHALIGGFHLGLASPEYTDQLIAELKAFAPDVVVPMHCSGQTFVDSVQKFMPDRLLSASAVASLNFGA
jgi:7,8-dihydropterin-6-yl-methyl-4-(beta-D-ribofuranosyl)aminobenzene 5'-phosphate synthase